jgi:FlaA1/EpsC-like NDP-sugar epimerase
MSTGSRQERVKRARRRVVLNRAFAVQAALDSLALAVGLNLAALLRVDFDASQLELWGQLAIIPVASVCLLVVGVSLGLYDGRYVRGSFEEAVAVGMAVSAATPLIFTIDLVASDPRMVPLTAVPGGAMIALVGMMAARWTFRMRLENRQRPEGEHVTRLLVVGAGEGADQVLDSMLRDPGSSYLPVALLDDDPDKRRLRVRGVPVVGAVDQIAEAARLHAASTVLIAIPTASREVIASVTHQANEAGLTVKVLPSVRDLLDGTVGATDIRDLEPADLLGRLEITTDVAGIADYVRGKRVLVTGAGGSIGSELCRQLAGFEPTELIMLDRDESALHALQLLIFGRALLDTPDVVLCDIRDRAALGDVFRSVRPQVVFHAAALKHLPMLEQYPVEGWKTNVLGSLNVLELAAEVGVERFVNISTDKAADPVSVLGYTKRIAERLTAGFARSAGGVYLSVRFGNVLGSRGSMLDTFTRQIRGGGPVTVTEPDVTRFFMTISEACQLVIQAGAIGLPGEVLVLDMGRPVRIADVAKQLIAQSGKDVDIVYTGLRPGEKLHEVLVGTAEVGNRRAHPMIEHVAVEPLDAAVMRRLDDESPDALIALLRELAHVPKTVEEAMRSEAG